MARYGRVRMAAGPRFVEVLDEGLVVLDGAPWEGGRRTDERLPVTTALLVPSAASKVVAIGQNYRKHSEEMGKPVPKEPLIFMKPSTALNAHRSPIVMPPASDEVHYEAELGLVIGRQLSHASEAEAAEAIFGLTCFDDVTARDIQKRETQHTRAKSYDTFACCGPHVVTDVPWDDLRVVCRVNGVVRQDGRTSDMVFGPPALVSFISHVMTLLPGDLVSTGTPSGVGALQDGDVVEVEVEGVGVLRNSVTRG